MDLTNFSPESKVWIYQSDRFFSATEKQWIQEQLNEFTDSWASHGTQLLAFGTVVNDFSILLLVDTSHANSSGCSIDKSVHFMKALGKELHIDFFNRLKVWIEENGTFSRIAYKELKQHPDAVYFDATVQTPKEFHAKHALMIKDLV